MKTRILFLLGTLLFSYQLHAQNPNFYIYLCFGQSNMEGQGEIEAKDKIGNNRFKVLQSVDCPNLGRTKGNWYTATPPLCRCWTRLSPSDYFGKTMIANLPDSITIGIINVAVGGCNIGLFDKRNYRNHTSTYTEDWFQNILKDYNGNPYAHIVNLAKQAQKDGVIKGILLHQGETNTGDAEWPQKVNSIYNDLLKDLSLSAESVPILAGEVVDAAHNGCCSSMNAIINKLPASIPTAHVISSKDCSIQDNAHFDAEGYRKLGRRYAVEMLRLMGKKAVLAENE